MGLALGAQSEAGALRNGRFMSTRGERDGEREGRARNDEEMGEAQMASR